MAHRLCEINSVPIARLFQAGGGFPMVPHHEEVRVAGVGDHETGIFSLKLQEKTKDTLVMLESHQIFHLQ